VVCVVVIPRSGAATILSVAWSLIIPYSQNWEECYQHKELASSHKPLAETVKYRVFLPLLDRQALARRSSEFIFDFLKVIITAIVGLTSIIDF
jgi:hypothetical protein